MSTLLGEQISLLRFQLGASYGVQFLIVPRKRVLFRLIGKYSITFTQQKQCYTGWVKKNLMFVTSVMLLIMLIIFFYSCGKINTIWDKVNFVISRKLNKNISLTVTDVLFGVHDKNLSNNHFIHHVIAIAKLCISKFRYGNHPNLLFLFEHELNIRYKI